MRVLVTGSGGFLGPHVVRAASEEWPDAEVVGLDLAGAGGAVALDLRDPGATASAVAGLRPDVVLHLAGLLTGPLGDLYAANVLGTHHLLDAVAASVPAARVVVVGSAAEYGAVPAEDLPVREDRAPSPLSPYGLSKAWQTTCALFWANRGLDVVVGRVFGMIGPGMTEDLFVGAVCAQLRRLAAAGGPGGELRLGDLGAKRDLIDVSDAASGLVALAARGRAGAVYNVCSGESIAMSELLDMLVSASGADVSVVRDPDRVRTADVPDSVGSPERIRSDTGWAPRSTLAASVSRAVAPASDGPP